jgi:Flp pilus assembly protein TadB
MGSSVVYGIEKWSIARATATHFLLVFALYFFLVISMGWFSLSDPVFWIVVGTMVAVYILIWLLQYLSYRRQIREMNDELIKWKSRNS